LDAAAILEPIREEVVVIGALAVQIALDGRDVALAPTGDIDAGVATEAVDRVVAHLEENGLRHSELPHERSFTWVQGDMKRLAGDDAAVAAAAREFVHGGREETQLAAETEVRRIARNALRRIAAD
jgi:hypothetical protein